MKPRRDTMSDRDDAEKRTRRRSRTVSWDHSVGSNARALCCRTAQQPPPQEPTSPGLRRADSSSVIEVFDDDDTATMSISRGHSVEKARFSASRAHSDENDEDYSASVNAILHKRLSVRKGKHQKQRRSSSPVSSMMPDDASLISDRRRSSAFTTSSGDTAINIEDGGISQEQIFENIRLHKEVLGSVRQQPWSIRRKMKLVQQAKEYVKKHEGQLQERLAMSKSTRDILARFHIFLVKQWQHSKREMANVISQIIPWELTIKEIESQFGTVVASYFTFLRWLFWVNFVISVLLAAFVVMPEMLTAGSKDDGSERKTLLPEEMETSRQLMTLLNFEGILQHSPMFYGYYSNRPSSDTGYRLPTAYFITGLVVYIYSFVATLRKMAANSRLSKLSEKDDECIFTWKLFTGWDYMIGNEETAHNRISSIILGFKEALLEEAERMKDKQNWKTVTVRIFANLNMVWMLGSSVYAVILVVARSTEPDAESNLWRKYEITVVMTLIGTFFPIAFEGLGVLESYHPRTTLRVQLARIMALNLLNLYTLTFALFVKINDMTKELLELKPTNVTLASPASTLTTVATALLTTAALLNSTVPTATTAATTVTATTVTATTAETTTRVLTFADVLPPICRAVATECPFPLPSVGWSPHHDATPATTGNGSTAGGNGSTAGKGSTTTCTSIVDRRGTAFGCDEPAASPRPPDTVTVAADDAIEVSVSAQEVHDDDSVEVSVSARAVNDTSTEATQTDAAEPPTSERTGSAATSEWTAAASPVVATSPPPPPSEASSEWTAATSPAAATTTTNPRETSSEWTVTSAAATSQWTATTAGSESESSSVEPSTPPDWNATDIRSDGPPTAEETAPSRNRRIKRFPEVLFNGTHCYRLVCSPPATPPVVTDYPDTNSTANSTAFTGTAPGFTDRPGDLHKTTTEHEDAPREDLSVHASCLEMNTRRKLRKLCWETMFGQELVKLTVMDLVSTIISTIFVDFARAVFVRYMNRCWCWNLEKRFPQYGDFKIAENILHLVNNQGMVWMGMFFSPGLPIINVVKLMIMMYVRSWAVLTCNVPHDVVFRASRSNNFYLGLLLTMLFLCVLPVGYAIVWIEPSWHCGPFSQYRKIYHIFTNSIKKAVPNPTVHRVLDYIASPGIIIPLLLLLILIIYYLASLTSSLREANNDLKTQLRRERTEERRKMFQLVNSNKRRAAGGGGGGGGDDENYACLDTTLAKWRQIMPDSCKLGSDGPTLAFGFAQKKLTENEVLDKVREKLVHIEADDQQPADGGNKDTAAAAHQQTPAAAAAVQQPVHHHHHHHQSRLHHHHHLHHGGGGGGGGLRRPSRNEDPRVTPALRKWKKSKLVASRLPSTESESSDQSEVVPEIRVVRSAATGGGGEPAAGPAVTASAVATVAAGSGEPIVGGAADHGGGDPPVGRQRARLKLAQILYKEARRRRQKYVEELQNQQE